LSIGCWVLAVGHWLLAIGYWLLAVVYWLFDIGRWPFWLLSIAYCILYIGYCLLKSASSSAVAIPSCLLYSAKAFVWSPKPKHPRCLFYPLITNFTSHLQCVFFIHPTPMLFGIFSAARGELSCVVPGWPAGDDPMARRTTRSRMRAWRWR
jgi:hypothetical protein